MCQYLSLLKTSQIDQNSDKYTLDREIPAPVSSSQQISPLDLTNNVLNILQFILFLTEVIGIGLLG
jgi:hypothetical protein